MVVAAQGNLRGDHVVVADPGQANRLYNKGAIGQPQSGNSLRLTLVEAAYALETGRLRLTGKTTDVAGLLAHAAHDGDGVEVAYLAYRDLRSRGLIVRPAAGGPADRYDLWPRGQQPPTAADSRVKMAAERHPVTWHDLAAVDQIALVDEDGAVTHYRVAVAEPTGGVPAATVPYGKPWPCTPLDDRVLVTHPDAVAAIATSHAGTPHPAGSILSLSEAAHLQAAGIIAAADGRDLAAQANARQIHYPVTAPVYADLRQRGALPRSGFKFGTHLRAYRTDADSSHADWMIQCVRPDAPLPWPDLSRAVRVAHGVKKRLLLAAVPEDGGLVKYLDLAWHRP